MEKSLVFLEALHLQFPCGALFGFFFCFSIVLFSILFLFLFFFVSDEPVSEKGRW